MGIRITEGERGLLLSSFETADLARRLFDPNNPLELTGSNDDIDSLRDACSDVLLRLGFDDDYRPNAEGKALEGLIDKLFVADSLE